ncbi:hypothetical protein YASMINEVIRUS_1194 [Yasminevirus sp. GU-2018]|uniref:VWFA domain-containing protein n=1 Tax=Yasminevirus sp. GU-2018 TaxID=2420051 RepID=A0A5K0UAY7_9VIRU|nr:hypothetical protein YASMINEVIRUS_1194 [Yasminevirus sp. GU-2018]
MGLGKKLGAQNTQTAKDVSSAHAPISEAGYNPQNLGIASAPPMTEEERKEVFSTRETAVQDIKNVNQLEHLKRPNVPASADADRRMINELVVAKMWRIVCLRKLQRFYSQEYLQKLVDRACMHDYRLLMKKFNIATIDMTVDLAVLGLYDIVLFGDDSTSMNTEEANEDNLTRWTLLKEVVKTLSFWASLMDEDGVVVRFINKELSKDQSGGISDFATVDDIFRNTRPSGSTPTARELNNKILNKFVYEYLDSKSLQRPILIITITDGEPDGGRSGENAVRDAIVACHKRASSSYYGEHAVAFSFAQIGTSEGASAFLERLDKDPEVGKLIDCTSEFNKEKAECERAYPGTKFTESTWLVKLMIGAVDPEYDAADEGPSTSHGGPSYSNPPPSYNPQYTGQQGYNQQPQYGGQYSAPPPSYY